MSATDSELVIECTECGFRQRASHDDDELPADVIISHGRDTGHTVSLDQQKQ